MKDEIEALTLTEEDCVRGVCSGGLVRIIAGYRLTRSVENRGSALKHQFSPPFFPGVGEWRTESCASCNSQSLQPRPCSEACGQPDHSRALSALTVALSASTLIYFARTPATFLWSCRHPQRKDFEFV